MFQLSEQDQRVLLQLARQSIQEYLASGHKPEPILCEPALVQKCGAFVTLRRHGRLRGCIGYAAPLFPLYKVVIEGSVAAATEDPRFPPMQIGELDEIEIEISVLSPLVPVEDVSKIEVGRHGLVVSHQGRRGLLLPQVAVDRGWERKKFLQETCRKAGLPPDDWEKGARIECFHAFVFKEAPPRVYSSSTTSPKPMS